MGDDPNQRGVSRRWIMAAVEGSLRRLQTNYIDLYQIQRPDPDTEIEETLSALTDLIRSGKVRAIGSSTTPASQIVEAQWVAERRGLERFHTEQPPYSILNRSIEREVLPAAERTAWACWSGGRSGRDADRTRPQGARDRPCSGRVLQAIHDERRLDAVERLLALAEDAGLKMTHMAMAFAIAHPNVTSALIGPRTAEHLDDLLAGLDVRLTDELLDRIDEIVPPGTDVGTLDQALFPRRCSTRRSAAGRCPNAPPPEPDVDRALSVCSQPTLPSRRPRVRAPSLTRVTSCNADPPRIVVAVRCGCP